MEHDHPESVSPERQAMQALEALPQVLGYVESDQLVQLRGELVEAMAAGSNTKELARRYRLLAEEVVESQEGEAFGRAQIGMLIHIGLMRRDGGRYDDYLDDLEDALTSARQLDFEDVVLVLEEVLDAAYE